MPSKMNRKSSPFRTALAAAEQKMVRLLADKERASTALARCDREIPAVERTIAALRAQLAPEPAFSSRPSLVNDGFPLPPGVAAHEVPEGVGFVPAPIPASQPLPEGSAAGHADPGALGEAGWQ